MVEGISEKDMLVAKRAKFADQMDQYLQDWQERQLAMIDRQAKEALKSGRLPADALTLWIQRLQILQLLQSIHAVANRGFAHAKSMAGAVPEEVPE